MSMAQVVGSISGLGPALGPVIGLEISLNVKQEECLQQGLRSYFSLYGRKSSRGMRFTPPQLPLSGWG
ncbi:hypothetical protein L3N51_01659 [Metallosphaera sp. J1]|nr:hypothetical protein [Metallosphaera javensis (ex Hofmann et al. 2022)]